MSALRLDLIVRRYAVPHGPPDAWGDLWTWRLWSGSRIVSSSGSQRYSRRIDCARGAEVGAGLGDVQNSLKYGHHVAYRLRSHAQGGGIENVAVRILDERDGTP